MVTRISFEQANRCDDGQESDDRNTRRQAAPVHQSRQEPWLLGRTVIDI
jgi:hypothetical protein